MATAENEEQAMPQAGWLGRTWEKVATVLAVIGLADLSGQLIKWAAAIHWIITKYAIVRAWLFGWLPFHIPPEWHDPIVLFIILFSVTNVGVYRSTQHTFVFHFFKEMSKFSGIARSQNRFVVLISTIFTLIVSYGLIYILKDYIPSPFYWSLVSPSLDFHGKELA